MLQYKKILKLNTEKAVQDINAMKKEIIEEGNLHCKSMVARGGGVEDLRVRVLKQGLSDGIISVDLIINVCSSMGANITNTIAEKTSEYILKRLNQGELLLRILSNFSTFRRASAKFAIPVEQMAYKGMSGLELSERIVSANYIAKLDPWRAATHNKGIMNGIDAVCLALGQDWRAVEAGAHAYASLVSEQFDKSIKYGAMTNYEIVEEGGKKIFTGELTLPMALGVVGGPLSTNPIYRQNLSILGNPEATTLSEIVVAIGLSQNLGALRALSSEGIQKGHMGLHARNIAIRVGAEEYLVQEVVDFLRRTNNFTEEMARNFLESKKMFMKVREITTPIKDLSSFQFEVDLDKLGKINATLLIDANINPPLQFVLEKKDSSAVNNEIHSILFSSKDVDWIKNNLLFMENLGFKVPSSVKQLKVKLQLYYLFYHLVYYNLLRLNSERLSVIDDILTSKKVPNSESDAVKFGVNLLLELEKVIDFIVESYISNDFIKYTIKEEFDAVRKGLRGVFSTTNRDLESFFNSKKKRLFAKLGLLSELAMDERQFSKKEVEKLLDLGEYLEIKGTLVRDKRKADTDKVHNYYTLFISKGKSKEDYFNHKQNELEKLESSMKQSKEEVIDFKRLLEEIEKLMTKYE